MKEGTFELGEAGFYTVDTVEENSWLNDKLDTKEYGIWYSVKFEGDAQKFGWQAKNAPVAKQKYWGWLEKTKSGKMVKFKNDSKNAPSATPSDASGGSTAPVSRETDWDDRNASIRAQFAIKTAVAYCGSDSPINDVEEAAKTFFAMVDRIKNPDLTNVQEILGDVTMDDIPY